MNKFMLNITASSGEYYQGDCEDLVLPISDGVYGIQAGHSPVLVAIHMGILHFEVNGESQDILVGDGIAEVTPAYVMVLVDSAERPEDIDKNRAEAARIRAEERLQHQQSMHEYYQSKDRARPCDAAPAGRCKVPALRMSRICQDQICKKEHHLYPVRVQSDALFVSGCSMERSFRV